MNRTDQWASERKKLWKLYELKGIQYCELRISPHCMMYYGKGFAHRHKRRWYYDKPELLGDFNQTLLACNACHDLIEYNARLTEEVFRQLRDNRPTDKYGQLALDMTQIVPLDKRVRKT